MYSSASRWVMRIRRMCISMHVILQSEPVLRGNFARSRVFIYHASPCLGLAVRGNSTAVSLRRQAALSEATTVRNDEAYVAKVVARGSKGQVVNNGQEAGSGGQYGDL